MGGIVEQGTLSGHRCQHSRLEMCANVEQRDIGVLTDLMNSSVNQSNDMPPGSPVLEIAPGWLTICVLVISGGTLIVNIPAAALVIFAKQKFPHFRSSHLFSLSLTDTFVGISLIPILLTYVFPGHRISYWGCNAVFLFFAMSHCNSKTQVTVICFDRLLLLIRPDWKYVGNYQNRMLAINIVTLVVICSIMTLPFWIFAKPGDHDFKCELDNLFLEDITSFCLYTGTVAFVVHTLIVGVCFAMIKILQKRLRAFQKIQPQQDPDSITSAGRDERRQRMRKEEALRLETRGIVTILSIAAIYTVCVTPLNLGLLAQGLGLISKVKRTTRHVLITFSCLNSAINPLVYCFRVPHVRRAVQILLQKM
ncbi:uncharacterized protein LOC132558361 [Ylistrum balloti]|uniref:uncharacterized protein LOC132558361 n=1 Tax=Ylistrum balloti TaxID=509963 RepID=UPI002905D9C5|nr:uncharacterized protein LOC132558361 [Ylistrum balloti]